MFIVAPYRSDVVARAFPWATVAVIALNVLVALACGFAWSGDTIANDLVVRWGTLAPWTWVTSAFVHAGWFHLIVNMVYLWAFGFVVEGLLGGPRFLLLCVAIAAGEGAVSQLLMLGVDGGGAAGASGVVYGLLAIAALWSPRSRLIVFVWIVTWLETAKDWPLLGFALTWIGIDLGFALLGGFAMSSALLHLIGAGVGLAAGLWLLKTGRVDTEGWDWLSLRERDPRPRAGDLLEAPLSTGAAPGRAGDPRAGALVTIRDRLEAGRPEDAASAEREARDRFDDWRLPPGDRDALVDALRDAGRADLARPYVEKRLAGSAEPDPADVLALADQAVRHERPTRALELLDRLDPGRLGPDLRREADTLRAAAEALRAEGRLELE